MSELTPATLAALRAAVDNAVQMKARTHGQWVVAMDALLDLLSMDTIVALLNAAERGAEVERRLARIDEDQGECRAVHCGYPEGFTCLDKVEHARKHKRRYVAEFRAKLLADKYLCGGCRIRRAVRAVPSAVATSEARA